MKDLAKKAKKYLSRYFVFGDITRPIIPFRINLLYWRPKSGDNVGDYLSKVVFDWCVKKYGLSTRCLITKRICMIGSVLSFIGGGKTTVWGTGLMDENAICAVINKDKKARLDIRAVRGPKTYDVLIKNGMTVEKIFGDPAILLPLIYKSKAKMQKGKTLIIPHHSRFEKYASRYNDVIDTYTADYKQFIDEIVSSEKVVSSSLHGLIIAESYGVPAVFLNDYPGTRFKYEDYYLSTGRSTFPMADSVEQAMNVAGEINPCIASMQSSLLESFPRDIFRIKKVNGKLKDL